MALPLVLIILFVAPFLLAWASFRRWPSDGGSPSPVGCAFVVTGTLGLVSSLMVWSQVNECFWKDTPECSQGEDDTFVMLIAWGVAWGVSLILLLFWPSRRRGD